MKHSRLAATCVAFLLAASAGAASAGELSGVKMPDRVQVGDTTLVLNGMGLREATALKVDVYVAGLYLPQRSSDASTIVQADEPKLLHLYFLRSVGKGDIVEAWQTGFAKNAGDQLPALRERVDRLNSWMTGFDQGDTLTFAYQPGRGTKVSINGKTAGIIQGDDFARALFSVWLGPKPPGAQLKSGLLGGSGQAGG